MLRSGDPAAAALLPQLEQFADDQAGWLALGTFLQEAGKYDAAIVALGRAARAPPPCAEPWHRQGQCLVATGRRQAAIPSFRQALRIDPAFAEGWYSLGLAQQDLGDHAAAADAYRAALRARPHFHEAALNLGISLQELGSLDDAIAAYGAALRSRPDSLARIAQALSSGRAGMLWLDPEALRRDLGEARGDACDSDPNR